MPAAAFRSTAGHHEGTQMLERFAAFQSSIPLIYLHRGQGKWPTTDFQLQRVERSGSASSLQVRPVRLRCGVVRSS
jgi:hypothetical protein